MTKVFAITSDALADSVTLVARDSAEAHRMFLLWLEVHAPAAMNAPAQIQELTDEQLAATPQLAQGAQGGIGVAWWRGHREGWSLGAPDGPPLGVAAPPVPDVHCFQVSGFEGAQTVYVFAETRERAIATLHLYSLDQSGCEADYESLAEVSPWTLTGPLVTLREAMFEGETGIGHECEDGFWRIFPADYDPPLRKRDGSVR